MTSGIMSKATIAARGLVTIAGKHITQEKAFNALQELALDYIDDIEVFEEFLEAFMKNGGDIGRIATQTHEAVSLDEFIDDKYFLGLKGQIYPELRIALKDIIEGGYVEAMFMGAIGIGKSLALDTPIITPNGWTTMGALQRGDVIFADNGERTTVTGAYKTHYDRVCYRVEFSDGTSIVADEEHLWLTQTRKDRMKVRGDVTGQGTVKTTLQIADTILSQAKVKNHSVPLAGMLEYHSCELAIDPYVMGVWLGVGATVGGTTAAMGFSMVVSQEMEARGYVCKKEPGDTSAYWVTRTHRGKNLVCELHADDLVCRKRVSEKYLRAGVVQRIALLQGLMDSCGVLNLVTEMSEFVCKSHLLVDSVIELMRGLGLMPLLTLKEVKGETVYYVHVHSSSDEILIYKVPGKRYLQRVAKVKNVQKHLRYITNVVRVESVPVRCISVDSESKLFLAGRGMTPTHNTTGAQIIQAYHLYLLSCEKFPQTKYGLMPTSTIVVAMLNRSDQLATQVTYGEFRQMLEHVPYFTDVYPFIRDKKSTMDFPKGNVRVIPSAAYNNKLLGMNVIGAIVDEMNFYQMVDTSKQARDGKEFNQAQTIYNALIRRRKSRFLQDGKLPGCICSVSSKGGPDDFMEQRAREALTEDGNSTYIFDKAQWDVVPAERFSGPKFFVEVGTERTNSRIVEKEADALFGSEVIRVPVEFLNEFKRDMEGSLRDYAGKSTLSKRPFFYDRDKIWAAAKLWDDSGFMSPFGALQKIVMSEENLPEIVRKYKIPNPRAGRVAHVDLGITGDACGFAVGHVSSVVTQRTRTGAAAVLEDLPVVTYDVVLQLVPPRGGELEISLVRQLIYRLKDAGLPIELVTFDQFQSTDSQQILRRKGIRSEHLSVDGSVSEDAYKGLRSGMFNERVICQENPIGFRELASLEKSPKGVIDHPLAGCFTGETLVHLTNGKTIRLDEMAGQVGLKVYTMDSEGFVREAEAINPRATKMATELVEIVLDNDQIIRCTPEHRFLLESGEYKEAQYLTEYDDLASIILV